MQSKSLDFLGFPKYRVTEDGKLFNKKNKELKPSVNKKGYHKYILQHNKVKRVYLVHQLVALAFIPNPNNYDTVDHQDTNTQNNNVSNLQWLPKSENSKRSWDIGNHEKQKKKVFQLLNGTIVNEYDSIAEASRKFGVHFSNISRACKFGRECKGYHWEFK